MYNTIITYVCKLKNYLVFFMYKIYILLLYKK